MSAASRRASSPDGVHVHEAPGSGYVHVCPLARGGMAEVSVVMRSEGRFTRLYALKRLQESVSDDEQVRAMFLDEARYAGLIRHANVVSVLDVGQDERGPFLVMDYIDGPSLDVLIRDHIEQGHQLPVQLALRIAAQVARGLHAAHELSGADGAALHLVHRDVSPQNVLLGYDGVARVADFGIAKAVGQSSHTATGVIKGKYGYMSPEQLRFEEPDRRADLFALGVVLYELLASARLYRSSEGTDGLWRILNEPPPDILDERDDVPDEVVALLFQLLAKEPAARPGSARQVAQQLEDAVAELVQYEGQINLADYLVEHFAEHRRARQDELDEQLRLAREHEADRRDAVVSAVAATAEPRRASWRAAWLVGLALLSGALSAGWILSDALGAP
jgi:serine/threonine-protein kinase